MTAKCAGEGVGIIISALSVAKAIYHQSRGLMMSQVKLPGLEPTEISPGIATLHLGGLKYWYIKNTGKRPLHIEFLDESSVELDPGWELMPSGKVP